MLIATSRNSPSFGSVNTSSVRRASAGVQAATVKHNQQLAADSPVAARLQAVVLATGLMDKCVALFFERLFHIDKHINRDFEKRMLQQISATLERLEHDCGAPWFFDDRMTQADITVGCLVGYMKIRVPDVFPADKYPKLHHLALHCETKEDFVKARPSPDETVPGQTRH